MYHILSPDGFPISPDPFDTVDEANEAIAQWVKRYESQGYYSLSNRDRLPLDEIAQHCTLIEL